MAAFVKTVLAPVSRFFRWKALPNALGQYGAQPAQKGDSYRKFSSRMSS